MKKILFILLALIITEIAIFSHDVNAQINLVRFSGRLKDIYGNPVQANITIYQQGKEIIVSTTQTNSFGSYSMSIPSGVYDVQYNLTDFSIPNYWIKLLSVNITSDTDDLLVHATESPNKVTFAINITKNATVQTYSVTKPYRISQNGTSLTEVGSQTEVKNNKWYYSENKIYFIATSWPVPICSNMACEEGEDSINCPSDCYISTDIWLHTDGKYIKDSQGNVVILHGICFETYSFFKATLRGKYADHTEQDYQKIAGWGFNVVRLGMSWEYIEPTEGHYNESYLELIDRDIEWARKNGIRIIFQFSQWFWSSYFDNLKPGAFGFPSWLFTGYPQTEEGRTQSQADFLQGKGPNGTVATAGNPSMKDRMINVWKYVATRYKNEPTILGYDLFNEPPGGGLGADTAMDSYLLPFYERLIDEIKTVDSNHIFIYEPIGGQWSLAPRVLNRPNVIFSTHMYTHHNDATRLGYSGNIAVLDNQINGYLNLPAANPSRNWNIPVLLGEFGPMPKSLYPYQNRYLWVNDMADLYNKYNFHWTYYSYCVLNKTSGGGCEYSIVNPDRTEIKEIADTVDKPYPRVSSAAPLEYSFDRSTKHFKVVFNGVSSVETRIYIPYRYYPNGFSVNSNSSSWNRIWNETNRILTVSAVLGGPIEIIVDAA